MHFDPLSRRVWKILKVCFLVVQFPAQILMNQLFWIKHSQGVRDFQNVSFLLKTFHLWNKAMIIRKHQQCVLFCILTMKETQATHRPRYTYFCPLEESSLLRLFLNSVIFTYKFLWVNFWSSFIHLTFYFLDKIFSFIISLIVFREVTNFE